MSTFLDNVAGIFCIESYFPQARADLVLNVSGAQAGVDSAVMDAEAGEIVVSRKLLTSVA